MSNDDPFWHLSGAVSFTSQEQFYDHLKRSNHLRDTRYEPDLLDKQPADRTRILGTTFERVSFSKTTIKGIIFRDCTFDSCQFVGSIIVNCEFHKCKFISTNTHKISISQSYIDPRSFDKCLTPHKHQNIGVHLYHELLHNSRKLDQIEFERDARFYFLRWKRFQDVYELSRLWKSSATRRDCSAAMSISTTFCLRWLWEKFFGSGSRIRYFIRTALLTELLFIFVNYTFRESLGLTRNGTPLSSVWESLYFTTISLTTLGYGDVIPSTTLGMMVAAIQSVIGFFLFVFLASMLFRRIVS